MSPPKKFIWFIVYHSVTGKSIHNFKIGLKLKSSKKKSFFIIVFLRTVLYNIYSKIIADSIYLGGKVK